MKLRKMWPHLMMAAAIIAATSVAAPLGLSIALTFTAFMAWTFVGLYTTRSAWRSTAVGQVVVLTNIALAFVLTQAMLSQWTDQDYPYREQVRIAMYGALSYGLVWKTVLLYRIQRADRKAATNE